VLEIALDSGAFVGFRADSKIKQQSGGKMITKVRNSDAVSFNISQLALKKETARISDVFLLFKSSSRRIV
jgi:hypothetical protein